MIQRERFKSNGYVCLEAESFLLSFVCWLGGEFVSREAPRQASSSVRTGICACASPISAGFEAPSSLNSPASCLPVYSEPQWSNNSFKDLCEIA